MLYSMVKMKSSSDNIIVNDRKSILHKNTEKYFSKKYKKDSKIYLEKKFKIEIQNRNLENNLE